MTLPVNKKNAWQQALIHAVTDCAELFTLLKLDKQFLAQTEAAVKLFPLKVPRYYLKQIEKGNMNDPLLKQILPLDKELTSPAKYIKDPLEESKVNPIPGLLHKYRSRVLVTLTSQCAVNCRYCFRRFFPYNNNQVSRVGMEKIADYIKKDCHINEVILSGGDPLIAPDATLKQFSDIINNISHIKRLRIHTRLPITLPKRITKEFIAWIKTCAQKVILVTHCNHPREITQAVRQGIQKLRKADVMVFNQSVLLQGVNDDVKTLALLSETLFAANILPYYLHCLDKVEGASHFDLKKKTILRLYAQLSEVLPGFLLPKLVYEDPNKKAKTLLAP